jgi:hypothetical protein
MLKNFFKIFNKKSIIKIFIIIIVGFIIRITVNYAYNINVFIDYTNIISIIYYYFMALFVVTINEVISQFQFPLSSFFSNVFSVIKKFPFVNLDDLKLSFLRKTINKFIYGSNKICLGPDNPVKDNYLKSNIDTPINLFHNGMGSKINKDLNVNKSYDSTSFYARSKGFTQIPQSNKDRFLNKSIKNGGYLNNSDSEVNNTKTDLSEGSRSFIISSYDNDNILISPKTNPYYLGNPYKENNYNIYPGGQEFSRSSLESNFTNDTNHATINYTDINKPYLNVNLNGYRKDADLRLFVPREISDVDINYRKEKIIQNTLQKAPDTLLEYTHEIVVPKEGLLDKLKLGFKYSGSKFNNSKSKLESIYIKYYDVSRRHFYWTIWESDRNNFNSYKDFKKSWDPKTKIWKEITSHVKKNIRDTIEDLIRINDPFKNKSIVDNKVKNVLYNHSQKKRK